MSTSLLEFIGIEKAFFGVKVLKGVSFSVGASRIVGLVGENGAEIGRASCRERVCT